MAGDWLKMDSSTPEKPEVLAITARMGWDDPDMTVGKLFRVWRWFDQHTTDGNAARVTSALLDRIAGVSGFAQAMQSEGWLIVSDSGLSLPKFDRHNGATAKARAQTAKRVANHRASDESNADSNAATVTEPLAREEKRREEKKDKRAQGTRLSKDWGPSPEDIAFADVRGVPWEVEAEKFVNHFSTMTGKGSTRTEWSPSWRTWCLNAVKYGNTRASNGASPFEGAR